MLADKSFYLWVLKERSGVIIDISSMNMFSIPKTMLRVERYIIVTVCVKSSTTNEFKGDYYGKLLKVIELQYHNEHNRVFLFKYYRYDTTNREIRVDPHYGLVEINSKSRLRNVNNVFVFAKQC